MGIRVCLGFGETEGRCKNPAGTAWSKFWCPSCDQARREYISAQLNNLDGRFKRGTPPGEGQ